MSGIEKAKLKREKIKKEKKTEQQLIKFLENDNAYLHKCSFNAFIKLGMVKHSNFIMDKLYQSNTSPLNDLFEEIENIEESENNENFYEEHPLIQKMEKFCDQKFAINDINNNNTNSFDGSF